MNGLRLRPLAVFLVLLLAFSALPPVAPAVLGIDYGSEWLKMVVVKSGKPMISVVTNEMSKRKAPAMVAFSGGERLLGEEAAAIVGRYPERVYQRVRDLLGASLSEAQALLGARYLAYDLVEDRERGSVGIRTHDGAAEYSAEELVAMVLHYATQLAEHATHAPIRDTVITVPPFWGQRQRQAMLDAAEIAGLKVMALLHEPTAAALQFGIDRKFENASQVVLLYDMGASSTRAALHHFSAYKGKDRGRSAVIGQVATGGVRWDEQLGGQTMEAKLAEHFADEFNAKVGGGVDIRSSHKAMAKLLKAVKKTKEVLSANSEAPIAVESLYGDHDFRSSITRVLFEQLCSDVWERATAPLAAVLRDANLTIADLDGFEIIGGATRVPRLQAALTQFLGSSRGVDKHLDADEAFAHGAGLHAANISDGFKLRPFGVVDGLPYGLQYTIHGANKASHDHAAEGDESAAEGAPRSLFQPLRKLPTKIIRSLPQQEDDFAITLSYDPHGPLPPGLTSHVVAQYAIRGVANATSKYQANATAPLKVALHFSLSRAGIACLDRGEMVVETVEMVEVLMSTATNGSTNASATATPDKATTATAQEDSADDAEGVGAAMAANATETPQTQLKPRKRTLRVPLVVDDTTPASLRGLSSVALSAAKVRHEALRRKDEEKRATAEAKNTLEAYILKTRTEVEEAADVDQVSIASERTALHEDLAAAEDWLYMEGADANATEFANKLADLRIQGNRIFYRLQELHCRPQILTRVRSLIARARKDVREWQGSRPWVGEAEWASLLDAVATLERWVDEKEAAQAARSLTQDPAFACTDVDAKATDLLKKIRKVEAIPKPKPKPKAKGSATSGNESSAENGTNSETAAVDSDDSDRGVEDAGAEGGTSESTEDRKNMEDSTVKDRPEISGEASLDDDGSPQGHDEL